MGFLSKFLSSPTGNDPLNPWWYSMIGRKVTSGVRVDHSTAMNYSAVWAATRLLTGTISTLPRELYIMKDGSKEPAIGDLTRNMFKKHPNDEQGSVVFLEQQFNHLINWGNSYAEIIRSDSMQVAQLWPIHPTAVEWEKDFERWKITDENREVRYLDKEDVFHVRGLFGGKGVIEHAAESIGMGLATEQFGASLFGNGAAPSVVLKHPRTLGEEGARNLRKSWRDRFSGPSKGNGVLVLEEGMDVTPLTIPPEQAQFLSTRQFNVTEIARWYNVPPHLLRELSKSSFNNIESESLHFILISVLPWLVRWEDECNRQLLSPEQQEYFFKFNVHGMLRGDLKTQTEHIVRMLEHGVYNVNESRAFLDMNPVDGGETRYFPLNMGRLGESTNEETDTNKADPQRMASESALRQALSGVLATLIGYESRQAVRMAANAKTFEDKCNRFFDEKFPATFKREIGQILSSFEAFGVRIDLESFAANHIEESRSELLALLDLPLSEFANAVQETVDGWNARVFEEVNSIFGVCHGT